MPDSNRNWFIYLEICIGTNHHAPGCLRWLQWVFETVHQLSRMKNMTHIYPKFSERKVQVSQLWGWWHFCLFSGLSKCLLISIRPSCTLISSGALFHNSQIWIWIEYFVCANCLLPCRSYWAPVSSIQKPVTSDIPWWRALLKQVGLLANRTKLWRKWLTNCLHMFRLI